MTTSSNKYANKVYSEHPIALWPLDEDAYYLSLIDDNARQFTNYTNTGTDRVNLVANPSFEINTNDWSAYLTSTISRVTTEFNNGSACLNVVPSNTNYSGVNSNTWIPVVGGTTYTLSAYVKVPSGKNGGAINATLATSTDASTTYSYIDGQNTVNAGGGWIRITLTATLPSVVKYVKVFITKVIATTNSQFYLDGVMLERSSSADSYFDGSTNGGAWIGAANASASVIHANNRVNLVTNPSLETNATGWNANAASAGVRSTAQAYIGSASYLATSNGVTNFGVWVTNAGTPISVTPGKIYTASFYVRDINTARQYASGLDFRDIAGGTTLSQPISSLVTVNNTGWTRVSVTGVAPTGATIVYPWCYTYGTAPTSGTQAYFDAALFEESVIAYPYFDGAQTSISYGGTSYTIAPTWSGTAHASTSVLAQSTAQNYTSNPTADPSPFLDSNVYSSFTKANTIPGTVEVQSQDLFSAINVSSIDDAFTVNMFLYQRYLYINWFRIGYRVTVAGSTYEELSDEIPAATIDGWINLNETFTLPASYSGSIKIFMQVNFKDTTAGDASSRTIYMNGLSVGQGSSLTCYESLGSTAIDLPSEVAIPALKGISADQYGMLADNGYYLVRNNVLLAHNDGLSMIYGTDICTRIEPSGTTLPSFIFPGKGMLHESGRNREFTMEMWLKVDPQTSTTFKIVGPLDSSDGIYVKEGFITIAINDNIGSHYVGEWYRPMLVDLILKENNAVLLINGEQVISVPYDRANANLSSGRDWWGVFSKSTFNFFAIDCIAIYPYVVSEIVAKRRFVYGQGTPNMQLLDSAYSGNSTSIDFATSQYGTGVMYPDTNRWDAAYFNNLDVTRDYVSVPNYSLPIINIGGRDLQEWYSDNYDIYNLYEYPTGGHPYFVTFRPNVGYKGVEYGFDEATVTMDQADVIFDGVTAGTEYGWAPTNTLNYKDPSYFNFPSLNILNDRVVAMYAIFEVEENIASNRTLIRFSNVINGDKFDVYLNGGTVYYALNGTVLYSEIIGLGLEFTVGMNFDNISAEFGYEVSKFFSSPSSIQVFVGGNGEDTFEGKIYNVAFCNQNNFDNISSNFYSNGTGKGGIINSSYANYQILTDHIASYSLIPEYDYGTLFLDISVSSEWEEFYPLSYFAGYIKDSNGNLVYDLDMLQLNMGYVSIEDTSVWSYQGLKDEFSAGTYLTLKTSTYKDSYFNLKKRNTSGTNINVGLSSLQGYITFQKLADGANAPLSSFDYTKLIDPYHIINADAENTTLIPDKAYRTKFFFVDNMIIFPPKSQPFEDYAMVVHLEIKQRAILKNPLKIRRFEISSKNFNEISETVDQRTAIGTKFGNDIYPYTEGVLSNFDKGYKPYFISKQTTPYLYNSKYAGINIINESILSTMPLIETKVSIPINKSAASSYSVAAMQFMIKPSFDQDVEISKIMDVNYNGGSFSLALNKGSKTLTVESYERNGTGFLADGGSPSTSGGSYVNVFNNDTPSSSFAGSVDFNLSPSSLISNVVDYNYSPISILSFYQNGKFVKQPIFKNNEWTVVGIIFNTPLNFGNFADGEIVLYGGGVFNNISYYLAEGLGIKTDLNERFWQNIKDANGVGTTLWSYWSGTEWQTLYITSQSSSYIITPENIYDAYTGTNGEIVDDMKGIRLHQGQAKIVSEASWSVFSGKPA